MIKLKRILFFFLIILIILFLLDKLNVITFIKGFIKVLLPLFIGLFISLSYEGLIKRFINKGYKRKKVTIIIYMLSLIVIISFIIILLPLLINQFNIFIVKLPNLIDTINKGLAKLNINYDINKLIDNLNIKFNEIINYFSSFITIFLNITLSFTIAIYISLDYENIKVKIKNKLPVLIKQEIIYFFSNYIPYFSKYIYSLLIDSVITFVISYLLFLILGIDYNLLAALIITITNLIPFIGPILGVIPLLLFGLSISSDVAIISVLAVGIVQVIESNILQPLIFKNVINLHPLIGIIGVLVFSYFFGIIGMFLSPLILIGIKILFFSEYKREIKQVTF